MDHLGLHRLIGADGSAATGYDLIPGWKGVGLGIVGCGRRGERLIEIWAPGELIPTVGNIRHTQRGVAVELPFDRQVPLDAVRVFLVPLIRSEECLRTQASASGALFRTLGNRKNPGVAKPVFEKFPWKPSWIPATEKNTAPKVVTS